MHYYLVRLVVSGAEETTGPDELREMMRSVVEEAESQFVASRNRNNHDTIKNSEEQVEYESMEGNEGGSIVNGSTHLSFPRGANGKEFKNVNNDLKKRVTFDLSNQSATDKKYTPYVSLQQRAALGKELKGVRSLAFLILHLSPL